jgi:hypothetical protein
MSYAAHSLFTYCGVSLVNDYTSPLPVYWWTSHLLFNGVPQFTTMTDHYYRDGQYMDAVPGISTALAGYTTSPATSQGAIVIRDDGTTIVNGFDVDENHEDLDADSFYDGVELYMNEIHFLLYGSDVPWLSEDPTSGTVSAGGSLPVDVIFNATGLALGDYTADLVIYSNDPDESPVTVPIVMHVVPEGKNYLPIILKNYP